MSTTRLALLTLFLVASTTPAFAAADSVVRQSVAVCDPNSALHCAAPDSSGNVPTKSTGAPAALTPLGYQQISGPAAATALTVPATATIALIEIDAAAAKSIRWRDDGVAPTAAVGMELQPGSTLTYAGTLSAFTVIQTAATAIVNVSYYK